MDNYISQSDKIVSWTQINSVDTLIQFYTNCYNYLPELFISAGIFAAIVGLYIKEIKYQTRILIIAGKMYLRNKRSLKTGGD